MDRRAIDYSGAMTANPLKPCPDEEGIAERKKARLLTGLSFFNPRPI